MAESKIRKLKRYSIYMVQWIIERIHGLDFTMRDLTLLKESGGVMHGYSKTDETHARNILDSIGVCQENRILDIGCGKGAFLKEAARYPFGKIAGIEIDERLARIAKNNFRILKLTDRVKVYCTDALKFQYYGKFNIFYLFNPFEKELMETVIDRIAASQVGKQEYLVILCNPVCASVIEEKGGKLVKKHYDKMKSYETYVYVFNGIEAQNSLEK